MRYQDNEVVLHTDARLMPRRALAWAGWNYHLPKEPAERVCVTYNMNILQGLRTREPLCVTLNRNEAIDPAKVLRRVSYAHPVFTTEAVAAQARHGEISGVQRTWYCGAYWRYGFHEDGIWSALQVLRQFAVEEGREREQHAVSRAG
jgi:predicted NAD/FAD-binding protein